MGRSRGSYSQPLTLSHHELLLFVSLSLISSRRLHSSTRATLPRSLPFWLVPYSFDIRWLGRGEGSGAKNRLTLQTTYFRNLIVSSEAASDNEKGKSVTILNLGFV